MSVYHIAAAHTTIYTYTYTVSVVCFTTDQPITISIVFAYIHINYCREQHLLDNFPLFQELLLYK